MNCCVEFFFASLLVRIPGPRKNQNDLLMIARPVTVQSAIVGSPSMMSPKNCGLKDPNCEPWFPHYDRFVVYVSLN